MAIASDAVSNPGATFTTTRSWTHTPVGVPRGVVVQVFNVSPSGMNEVASVTYGGAPLTSVMEQYKLTGEPAGMGAYFRGAGLPTGPQTVTVTVSGTTVTKAATCRTLTAARDLEGTIAGVAWKSDSLANPTGTLALLATGRAGYCLQSFVSGHAATTSVTPLPNWTGALTDFGVNVAGEYAYNIVGPANVTVGWTQALEDATGWAAAFAEVPGSGGGGEGGPVLKSMGDLMVWALQALPAGLPVNERKDTLYANAKAAFPAAYKLSTDDALHQHLNALWNQTHTPVERITAITTGQPGTYTPSSAPVPAVGDFNTVAMRPPFVTITPTTPWPVADWVVAAGGERMSWNGFSWLVKP